MPVDQKVNELLLLLALADSFFWIDRFKLSQI